MVTKLFALILPLSCFMPLLSMEEPVSTCAEVLIKAVREGNTALVQSLIEQGVDVNNCNKYSSTALHEAAHKTRPHPKMSLNHSHTEVEEQTKHCNFINEQKIVIAQILIASGADINKQNTSRSTPLINASSSGNEPVAHLLLQQPGILVNVQGANGDTAFEWALINHHYSIVDLIMDHPSFVPHPASPYHRSTVLHLAAAQGEHKIVEKLLKIAQDNLTTKDHEGNTPLHLAAITGKDKVVAALIKDGSIDMQNNKGNTPLHEAILGNHIAIVTMLVNARARTNLKNNNNLTAVELATQQVGYFDWAINQTRRAIWLLVSSKKP